MVPARGAGESFANNSSASARCAHPARSDGPRRWGHRDEVSKSVPEGTRQTISDFSRPALQSPPRCAWPQLPGLDDEERGRHERHKQ
jgi:hypothetical protein